MEKPKVLIATPFYRFIGYSNYINSLIQTTYCLTKANIIWEFVKIDGDSYVDRARNTIATKFLNTEFTDLFFIDSDIGFDVESFLEVLLSPYLVCGAAYPTQNAWDRYTVNTVDDIKESTKFAKCYWLSTGFLRIKKQALLDFIKHYPDDYYFDATADPERKISKFYNFFSCEMLDKKRMSEDVSFCLKYKNIGGEIYCYTEANIQHLGTKIFEGNYKYYTLYFDAWKGKEYENSNTDSVASKLHVC